MSNDEKIRVPYALAVHGEEEERAVLELLWTRKTIMGEKTKQFESEVASLFGKQYGIMVNSGSSANFLALELLNLPEGSEVITPVLTFSTTVAPLLQKRLKPVFIDVEPGSYQIDLKKIREKITSQTKLLMIPSLIGNIPDLAEIRKIAQENNLYYIEDSCDTIGGTFDGLPTGSFSDISTSSFYGSHIITAAGGGGILCVNNKEWDTKARVLRGWGRSSAIDESEDINKRFNVELEGIKYDSKFIFQDIGYNFLPTEISAAFGLEQIKKLKKFTEIRINNFNELYSFFKNYERFFILPKQLPHVRTNWLAFPLTLQAGAPFTRSEITIFLEQNNIQTRPIFTGNILRQPAFKSLSKFQSPDDFPVADHIMRASFLVGCNQGLEKKHIDYMKRVFTQFLSKY